MSPRLAGFLVIVGINADRWPSDWYGDRARTNSRMTMPLIVSCRQISTQHISERAVRRTSRVRFISLGPGKASVEKHRRQAVLVDNAGGNAEDEAHQFLLIERQIPAVHE